MKEFKRYALDTDDDDQVRNSGNGIGEPGDISMNDQRKVVELTDPVGAGCRLRQLNWQYWYVLNGQRHSFDFV